MQLSLSSNGMALLETIREEYFAANLPIKIQVDVEGQKLDADGNFIVGCKAGPSLEVSHLLHEMAHFAEREISHLLKKPDRFWGFYFGKYHSFGSSSFYQPESDASTRRELRVWAFQYNLERYYKIETTIEKLVSTAVYINSFCLYNPFKEDRHLKEEERLKLAAEEVKELSETTYTKDFFDKSWRKNCELLSKSF